jgi:hypothetical protein
MAEKDQDQQTEGQDDGGKKINDPLTRRDVEAPRKEFEGTKPE